MVCGPRCWDDRHHICKGDGHQDDGDDHCRLTKKAVLARSGCLLPPASRILPNPVGPRRKLAISDRIRAAGGGGVDEESEADSGWREVPGDGGRHRELQEIVASVGSERGGGGAIKKYLMCGTYYKRKI